MKNSLTIRFLTIIAAVVIAAVTVWLIPPKLGIDLAGGTSLLYELDLSKIPPNSQESSADLAARVIEVLKKRVDPYGQKNMIWRVVGGKRIQIQMPQADAATRKAQDEEKQAREALENSSLKMAEVMSAIEKPAAQRGAAIDAMLKSTPGFSADSAAAIDQRKLIEALAKANDDLSAVEKKSAGMEVGKVPDDLLKEQYDAQSTFDAAQLALKSSNLDVAPFQSLLTAADNPKNADAQSELAAVPAKYPRQQALIEHYVAAHKKVMELSGGGVDDPVELQRLVTAAGVLDFRIAVVPGEINEKEYQSAEQSLRQYGPERDVTVGGAHALWFEIDPDSKDNFRGGAGYVTATWASQSQPYLLCYDDASRSLTHSTEGGRKPWTVQANAPYSDPQQGGALVLPFRLDAVGARYMADLTGNNVKHPMAILLDNKAITAPNINSQISDNGEITFGTPTATRPVEAIRKEAEQLKQIMDAGSLPATLQKDPISVTQITSEMGKDNIDRGIRSAYYAVGSVVGFMLIYYTITGIFADLALMLNLLLVMAAMALFRATFTLPGIAGLVLTLGMAVDANVLINERIREELHKGASLWMAIKQGYDKVFWTIFDANLTCSLTSIVLIYVGSEEVKGFGVTLLIGLMIHMFTALFVTRTLMMAGVRWAIIRAIDDHSIGEYLRELFTLTWLRNGHWPFMRVITVSNIDWIGKRHVFWAISALVTIAGMVAFVARGQDKYDIEFRGGTQVTFSLKPDAAGHYLDQDQFHERIEQLATTSPALKDLAGARVYGVGDPAEHEFEMQTTINNPRDNPGYVKATLLDPLAKKFEDVLDVTRKVSITHMRPEQKDDVDERRIGELIDQGYVKPITENSLDQVFAKTDIKGIPNRDVSDFKNGTAILLDDISPPQTAAQLEQRIKATRQSPDISSKAPYRAFKIIPVTAIAGGAAAPATAPATVPAAADDKRPLTRAVMVSLDPSIPYDENTATLWQTKVAGSEWQIVRTALSTEMLFRGVTTFDAVVADQAKRQAVVAIILSLVLIVIYVWVRFGGIWYGIGAIFSLIHDAVVAVAATVLSGEAFNHIFGGHTNWLLITDFKINLTMIAAYLTIIGYSVNDTIVIFDRVRELRGRSTAPLSPKLINDAINQCFGRTIWTTFTVFIVVLIMYIWGGEGVRGFSFAMLIGVITGAYSTLAIASPMLLTTSKRVGRGPGGGERRPNPFMPKSPVNGPLLPQSAPALPKSDSPPNLATGST